MPLSTWSKTKIYLGSLFLTPFGLYWFFKYWRDSQNKKVAYISLVITLVSFIFGLLVADQYVKAVNNYLKVDTSGLYGL